MLKVSCAIILSQNKILVTQRNANSDHPLKWEFPGGKINENESAEECIIREIKEELDVEIEILEKLNEIVHQYGLKQIELIPFLCTIKSGHIKLIEHNDYDWVSMPTLPEIDFAEADKKIIENHKNKSILEKYLRKNMYNTR